MISKIHGLSMSLTSYCSAAQGRRTAIRRFVLPLYLMSVLVSCASAELDGSRAGSDAIELHTEVQGSGAPVLLIHGFGASTYTWRHLAPALAQNFRVVAVDLKGFGQSPKPRDGRYSIYDQVDLIEQLIYRLDLKNVIIVGHSYGGGVALLTSLRLIAEDPARLSRLVLIGSAAYEQGTPAFIRLIQVPLLGDLAVRLIPESWQAKWILRRAYYDDDKITEEIARSYSKPLRHAGAKYAVIRTARSLRQLDSAQIAEQFTSISVPTFILWGRHDRIIPLELGQRLAETIPNSSLRIIENCGHIPHEEHPEVTISLIREFLLEAGR